MFDEKYYQASDDASEDLEAQKDIDHQLLNDTEVKELGVDQGDSEEMSDLED